MLLFFLFLIKKENNVNSAQPFTFRLYMIRHGQTDANGNTYQGEVPFDLNSNGISQMEEAGILAKGIKGKMSALFCSQMLRAKHSAEIVNKYMQLKTREIADMREFKIGILQGKTKEVYAQMLAKAKESGQYGTLEQKHSFVIEKGFVDGQFIDGESVNIVFDRAMRSLREIGDYAFSKGDEAELAIVHDWWTRCLIAKKYGIDKDRIKIENGGFISLVVTLKSQNVEVEFDLDNCRKCLVDSIELKEWIKK